MTVLPKAIHRVSAVPIKLPMASFTEKRTKYFTICMETQDPKELKQSWERKMQMEESRSPTSDYTQSCVAWQKQTKRTQYVQYRHKNRNIDSWSRTGGPEKNSNIYRHLTYDKGDRNVQQKKDSLFNTWPWETVQCKRMKLEHYLTPYTKIKSKWIKDLNIRPDTVELWHKSQQDLFWSTS